MAVMVFIETRPRDYLENRHNLDRLADRPERETALDTKGGIADRLRRSSSPLSSRRASLKYGTSR